MLRGLSYQSAKDLEKTGRGRARPSPGLEQRNLSETLEFLVGVFTTATTLESRYPQLCRIRRRGDSRVRKTRMPDVKALVNLVQVRHILTSLLYDVSVNQHA